MKKLVIVAIAVLLALPVLSNAAPVNNKWDMTIGGFVQFHMGWVDQNVGSSFNKNTPNRDNGSRENAPQEITNLFAEGQSRLNFIVKGPDAWGAKTMGRLEFDFTTVPAGESIGLANFRHSYMQFDWANDSLIIGNTWYTWNGATAPGGGLTFQSLPNIMIPSRTPQIRWTHKFGKDFQTNFALEYPGVGRWMAVNNNYSDRYTNSGYPTATLNVTYASGLCGKIGPETLKFGASAVYGREKVQRSFSGTAAQRGTTYSNKQNDGWIATGYGYVPIIPERNMNKAGALGIQGGYAVGQGLSNYSSANWIGTYQRVNPPNGTFTEDFSTPRGYGYYAALTAYAHDKLHFDLIYSDQRTNASDRWANRIASQTSLRRTQLWNLAMMYEPNPAILMGAEVTRLRVDYAQRAWVGNVPDGYKKQGTLNAIRFFAQYSF